MSKVEIKIFSETIKKMTKICSFFRSITPIFTNSSFHVRVSSHICLDERMCSTHGRMIHRRKGQKKKREKSKTGKWMRWEEQNTKSEKYEAKSGTGLKSRKRAFKWIQRGVEVISCIGDLSLK